MSALEDYLEEYNGVLVIVSHDRFFTDKVTDHLFVFEGNGIVKDFTGTLTDYSECLVELENAETSSSSVTETTTGVSEHTYKEDKQARVEKMNKLKKSKREMQKLEKDIEKLKEEASALAKQIEESSDEGWTFLAELTDKMNEKNEQVDEKEMRWLELAEIVEELDD